MDPRRTPIPQLGAAGLALLAAAGLLGAGGTSGETPAEAAAAERERALSLRADVANGLRIYRICADCHQPEGWGLPDGSYPQLAGQHRTVIIKELADIRAGNRDNPAMLPHVSLERIGDAQAVADVAGYIDTLEISVATGKGSGEDLELGGRLYAEHCARCHGPEGEGDGPRAIPRIQSQHYEYLLRQFRWIKAGERRNADPEMVARIRGFSDRDARAVLDYVSRLEPAPEFQAPPDWRNPDFMD
jgi:cytochrome c553